MNSFEGHPVCDGCSWVVLYGAAALYHFGRLGKIKKVFIVLWSAIQPNCVVEIAKGSKRYFMVKYQRTDGVALLRQENMGWIQTHVYFILNMIHFWIPCWLVVEKCKIPFRTLTS